MSTTKRVLNPERLRQVSATQLAESLSLDIKTVRHWRDRPYPDRLCFYHDDQLIARHTRSFERHLDNEDPDHPKVFIAQRRHAQDAQLLKRFLSLSPQASAYYTGLQERRGNVLSHVRKIVALAELHGEDAVVRAMQGGTPAWDQDARYL